MCAGPIPQRTVTESVTRDEASLWVTHELCGYCVEDTLVLCVPYHQSNRFDRLGYNASSAHFIFTLFTYLCGKDDYSNSQSALKRFLPLFFSSWYKHHPAVGRWGCNGVIHFHSAWDVKAYTSHQRVVGFGTPFISKCRPLWSNTLQTCLKEPQSEDAETLQNIFDNTSLLLGRSIIYFLWDFRLKLRSHNYGSSRSDGRAEIN